MAGRSILERGAAGERRRIDVALGAAPIILVAVVLHALAFTILDVGTRPPGRLVEDIRNGFGSPRIFLTGMWRLVLGVSLLFAGGLLLLSQTIFDIRTEFFTMETGAIVAGLLVEMLIGDPVRRAIRRR